MSERRRRARRTMDSLLIFIGVMTILQWVMWGITAWSLYEHINTPYADPKPIQLPRDSVPSFETGYTHVVQVRI
jgi:hypothetical protein